MVGKQMEQTTDPLLWAIDTAGAYCRKMQLSDAKREQMTKHVAHFERRVALVDFQKLRAML